MLAGFEKVSGPICRDEMSGIEQAVLDIQKTQPLGVRLVVERLYAVAYRAQNDIELLERELLTLRKLRQQMRELVAVNTSEVA